MNRGLAQCANEIWLLIRKPESVLALCYTVVGFLVIQGIDHYKTRSQELDKRAAERVIAFIDTTLEFDALVPAMAYKVMEKNAPDAEARDKLVTNLSRQYSELQDLAPLLKSKEGVIRAYQQTLSDLNRELPKANSVLEMADFWTAVGQVISTRKPLTAELRRTASLKFD
jgi:hypothetical protein